MLAISAGFAIAATPAEANSKAVVAQGPQWAVDRVPGGYEVSLELRSPVPLRAAAPELRVNGEPVGIAKQSLDGTTLTTRTTDPRVARATAVELGWSGVPSTRGVNPPAEPQAPATPDALPRLDADPMTPGQYAIGRADYDLGDEAIDIRGFDRRGEMRAAVYLPTNAPGRRPVVLLLHGRHSVCAGGKANPAGWPCGPGQTTIPSFAGYATAAKALAGNGYVVVSISANAINALDGTLANDGGAVARGQLVLDHLELLRRTDDGRATGLSPQLHEKLDLDRVGLMGHSRGGEGVVRATLLNSELDHPFGIRATLPLAPTDFGRSALPDSAMAVVLPYCDGDVWALQGQHYFDDSRNAYADDVLRSSLVVMGANHNFFNSIWTPSTYPTASTDDWFDQSDTVCGRDAPGNIRLGDAQQDQVGAGIVSGFFRLVLGGEQAFLPMFDGTGRGPRSYGGADVRVSASLPAATRRDLTTFERADPAITTKGDITAAVCASVGGLPFQGELPPCVDGAVTAPDFAPVGYASSVPATPATHIESSGAHAGGSVQVALTSSHGDLSRYESVSLRLTPDPSSDTDADLTVALRDAAGNRASQRLADITFAGRRFPGTEDTRKVILQQAVVPLRSFAGVDLANIQEIAIDVPAGSGGILLSDLTVLPGPSVGNPAVSKRPSVTIADLTIDEGKAQRSVHAAAVLSTPATTRSTAFFSVPWLGEGNAEVMQPVVFEPGETCRPVTIPFRGDVLPSRAPTVKYMMSVGTTAGGIVAPAPDGSLVVREDDGVLGTPEPPPAGIAGDPCAEAQAGPVAFTLSSKEPEQGDEVALTANGFRAGEGVETAWSRHEKRTVIADRNGTVRLTVRTSKEDAPGEHAVQGTGFGSGQRANGAFELRAARQPEPTPSPTSSPTAAPDRDATGPDPRARSGALASTGAPFALLTTGLLAAAVVLVGVTTMLVRRFKRRRRVL